MVKFPDQMLLIFGVLILHGLGHVQIRWQLVALSLCDACIRFLLVHFMNWRQTWTHKFRQKVFIVHRNKCRQATQWQSCMFMCINCSDKAPPHTHVGSLTIWNASGFFLCSQFSLLPILFPTTRYLYSIISRCYKWWFSFSIECRAFCWLYVQPSVKYHPPVEKTVRL